MKDKHTFAKKLPEMVVKLSFMSQFYIETEYRKMDIVTFCKLILKVFQPVTSPLTEFCLASSLDKIQNGVESAPVKGDIFGCNTFSQADRI